MFKKEICATVVKGERPVLRESQFGQVEGQGSAPSSSCKLYIGTTDDRPCNSRQMHFTEKDGAPRNVEVGDMKKVYSKPGARPG